MKSEIVGETESGSGCVSGMFKFRDTYGLPLVIIANRLKQSNLQIAWDRFYIEAREAGWKPEKILADIRECVSELWSRETAEYVCSQLSTRFEA